MSSESTGGSVQRTDSANSERIDDDLDYITSMFETIAAGARAGYTNEGRGAMIVDLTNAPEVGGGYLSISRLLIELGAVPDKVLERTLGVYDPATEFVAVVRRPNQSLHGYIFRY